jgi:hypothetical protein
MTEQKMDDTEKLEMRLCEENEGKRRSERT